MVLAARLRVVPPWGCHRGARSCAATGNRRSGAQAFVDTANSREQSTSGVTHGYEVSTAATLTPGVALHGHARRTGLPLEALRGCWMPADSNPTNEMLALYRFCRFSTPPSAPTASPDVPTSPFTRSGPSYQSVHRFGDAPAPAGPSLRPVSPPLTKNGHSPRSETIVGQVEEAMRREAAAATR